VTARIILHTDGLTKYYGALAAVKDLTLDIYQGEVFGLLGPNGAGKTTTINMLCGLVKPDAGQVRLTSERKSTAAWLDVGMCPQEIIVWKQLTCLEQMQFVGEMYGLPGRDARRRSERLLADLGLSDKRNQLARTLSGGMQRRLNLALALVHDPGLLVLDEPEAGLDPQSRVLVRDYIKSLAHIKTVIVTTHNMDEADRLADRVAIIDHGELLALDTPDGLKRRVGQGDVIEIVLSGDRDSGDRARASLNALASRATVHMADNLLTVRALNAATLLPAVLNTLGEAQVACGEIRLRENTLEDVFIQLTGRRLRE
jgi:ABC-2 type transport system ATP-binding protein